MSKDEAIREACSIVALAYRSIGDYSRPSDGFCNVCKPWGHFQNDGHILDYVRLAVVEKLKRDGFDIYTAGFDPITGKEIRNENIRAD